MHGTLRQYRPPHFSCRARKASAQMCSKRERALGFQPITVARAGGIG